MDGYFLFDYKLGAVILVDTGATTSVCPRHLCSETGTSDKLLVSFTGEHNRASGTVERILDLGLDSCITHTFTVADVNLPFLIIGFDFLTKHQIGFDGDRQSYVHFPSGQVITTRKGSTKNAKQISKLATTFIDARKSDFDDQPEEKKTIMKILKEKNCR